MGKTKELYEKSQNQLNEEYDFRYREAMEFLTEVTKSLKSGKPIKTAICSTCHGTGEVEVIGDGENFECDVIDVRPCHKCSKK